MKEVSAHAGGNLLGFRARPRGGRRRRGVAERPLLHCNHQILTAMMAPPPYLHRVERRIHRLTKQEWSDDHATTSRARLVALQTRRSTRSSMDVARR